MAITRYVQGEQEIQGGNQAIQKVGRTVKSYDYDDLQNEATRIIQEFEALIEEAEASLDERAPILKKLRSLVEERFQKGRAKMTVKELGALEQKSRSLDELLEGNLPDSLKKTNHKPGLSRILRGKLRI